MATVRPAHIDETHEVLAFYWRMIEEMRGTDFDIAWERDVHPTDDAIVSAVAADNAIIVLEAGEIVCALLLDGEGAPGYESAPWTADASDGEYQVIHVLGTLPAYHGKGYARLLVHETANLLRERGVKAIRLDTFSTNYRAHNLYESCGFMRVGSFVLTYEELGPREFILFELPL